MLASTSATNLSRLGYERPVTSVMPQRFVIRTTPYTTNAYSPVKQVKCSGEKTGCNRCISLSTSCVYVESRVGKVQGVRTTEKKTQAESDQSDDDFTSRSNLIQIHNDDDDEIEGRDGNRAEVSVSNAPTPNAHVLDPRDQVPLQGWSPGSWTWNNDFFPLDGSVTSTYTGDTGVSGSIDALRNQLLSVTPSSVQTQLIRIDCENIGDTTTMSSVQSLPMPIFRTTTSRPPTFTDSPPPQPTKVISRQRQQTLTARNSKCVLALANMVITLENYLISNLKVLDLIISSVRLVAEEMRRIIHYQRESRNDCCIFLSTTVMYQVTALLESGANAVLEREGAEQGHAEASEDFEDFTPKVGSAPCLRSMPRSSAL
jgi:hypothetical protein